VAVSDWHQCALFFSNVTCWGSGSEQIHVPANILTMSVGLSAWFGLGADGRGYFWGATDNFGAFLDRARLFEGGLTLSAVGSSNETPCGIEAETDILFCWSIPSLSDVPSNPVAFRPPS
jgi:hypothetical protein